MTIKEWINKLPKDELTFRMKSECYKCGFYQQDFSAKWFCTRRDIQKDCFDYYKTWREYEL